MEPPCTEHSRFDEDDTSSLKEQFEGRIKLPKQHSKKCCTVLYQTK